MLSVPFVSDCVLCLHMYFYKMNGYTKCETGYITITAIIKSSARAV